MPAMSNYTIIAVAHDLFYRNKGVCTWIFDGQEVETKINKARADLLFKEGMEFLKITPAWRIPVMYQAVHRFGGKW